MQRFRKYSFTIWALAAIQLVGTGLFPSLHHDFELLGGTTQQTVTSHADADHCKHLPLTEHSHCAVCQSAQSRITPEPLSLGTTDVGFVPYFVPTRTSATSQSHLFESFSRRGPPFLLG
jgi:hypothetical protein